MRECQFSAHDLTWTLAWALRAVLSCGQSMLISRVHTVRVFHNIESSKDHGGSFGCVRLHSSSIQE